MVPSDDPNTPSTPTTTNNASFTTPRRLHSHANDAHNDPLSFYGYKDDDNLVQSPMANASTVPVFVTQTQSSPDLNIRSAADSLLLLSSPKVKKRAAMKDLLKATAKMRRVCYPIKNKLLPFLRTPYIVPPTTTVTAPSYAFGPVYKSANNHWQNKRNVAWKPFKSVELKKVLKHAPHALSILHNRLLLEDIMRGDGLVCSFPNDDTQLFKFFWFLNNPVDIQLWKVGGTARYVLSEFLSIHY